MSIEGGRRREVEVESYGTPEDPSHCGVRYLEIRGFADLARKGLRIINCEQGSGARLALDEGLRAERYGVVVSESDFATKRLKVMLGALGASRFARGLKQFGTHDTD